MPTEISISGSVHSAAGSHAGDGLRSFPAAAAAGAPAAPPATEPAPIADAAESLRLAAEQMASKAAERGAELDFRVDEDSGRVVVSVVDRTDGTVLRQIPSEEALRIARVLAQAEPHLIQVDA